MCISARQTPIKDEHKENCMKDIIGYEGLYAVTDDGKVWSYPKPCSSKNGMWLKLIANKSKRVKAQDYIIWIVGLRKNNKVTRFLIHRLVADAFIPNPENKPQVNHKDGNPANNHADNLEWVDGFENMQHAQRTGLTNQFTEKSMANRRIQGKKNWRSAAKSRRMFTMEEANEIREMFATTDKSHRAIAIDLGCSNNTISNICNNKTYQFKL